MKHPLHVLVLASTFTLMAVGVAPCQSMSGPSQAVESPADVDPAASTSNNAPGAEAVSAPREYALTAYTATRLVQPYVFLTATGTLLGINGDSDAGFTLGGGWEWLPSRSKFSFAPEIRWSYWVPGIEVTQSCECGTGHARESFLRGGLVLARNSNTARRFNRIRPFADVFYGTTTIHLKKGEISDYGFTSPTTSALIQGRALSVGGGIDYRLSVHFNLRSEVLFNRTDVTSDAVAAIWSQQLSIGVSYRF